jgi:hypothetical protein
MSAHPLPARLRTIVEVSNLLVYAAEAGPKRAQVALRRRRGRAGRARKPGADSPMWNLFAAELRDALRPHGSKVRLARYLGIPKQRITDFLTGRRRLPDAELTLRLLHWLAEERRGRNHSL